MPQVAPGREGSLKSVPACSLVDRGLHFPLTTRRVTSRHSAARLALCCSSSGQVFAVLFESVLHSFRFRASFVQFIAFSLKILCMIQDSTSAFSPELPRSVFDKGVHFAEKIVHGSSLLCYFGGNCFLQNCKDNGV